mmetsp:Transcript_16171/g.36985  ORF Transcript_16171/g.36985 Transcript_16171/m.36985 type:complete len:270 (+) Transcript_16171:738-1547(+)
MVPRSVASVASRKTERRRRARLFWFRESSSARCSTRASGPDSARWYEMNTSKALACRTGGLRRKLRGTGSSVGRRRALSFDDGLCSGCAALHSSGGRSVSRAMFSHSVCVAASISRSEAHGSQLRKETAAAAPSSKAEAGTSPPKPIACMTVALNSHMGTGGCCAVRWSVMTESAEASSDVSSAASCACASTASKPRWPCTGVISSGSTGTPLRCASQISSRHHGRVRNSTVRSSTSTSDLRRPSLKSSRRSCSRAESRKTSTPSMPCR